MEKTDEATMRKVDEAGEILKVLRRRKEAHK